MFLTDVVTFTSLCWLRSLELVFPPYGNDYLSVTRPAYSDWLQTLDYIKDELDTPLMNLHMHMADPEEDSNGTVVGGRTYRPNFTKEQSKKAIIMYVRLLKTFTRLRGFKGFTMHLALPWGWDQADYRRPYRSEELWEAYERKCVHMQEFFGRKILGENYDQFSRDSNRKSNS